jgi:hypothetical protein
VPTDDGSLVSTRDGRADAVVAITDPDFQKRLPSFVGAAVGVIEPKPEVAVALIDLQLGLPLWVDQQAGDLVSTGTSDVVSGAFAEAGHLRYAGDVNVEQARSAKEACVFSSQQGRCSLTVLPDRCC